MSVWRSSGASRHDEQDRWQARSSSSSTSWVPCGRRLSWRWWRRSSWSWRRWTVRQGRQAQRRRGVPALPPRHAAVARTGRGHQHGRRHGCEDRELGDGSPSAERARRRRQQQRGGGRQHVAARLPLPRRGRHPRAARRCGATPQGSGGLCGAHRSPGAEDCCDGCESGVRRRLAAGLISPGCGPGIPEWRDLQRSP